MKRRFFLPILLLIAAGVFGQSISNKQFSPDVRWKQIETERFILIFTEELQDKALGIAEMIDSYYPPVEASLGTDGGKWPIILNNRLAESNAYVTLAPMHSQLYSIPPQSGFLGTGDWLSTVWSHELRHIIQTEKTKRGFTGFASLIAGEYGWSGMSHIALPHLYWEGDAVLTETLLGQSGRGRLPSFERELRTNLLADSRFGYNKSALGGYGSFTDRVPSWYVTGYYFCSYIRRHYGLEVFNEILETAADFSLVPLISNIAVSQKTGKTPHQIWDECLTELTELWTEQMLKTPVTEAAILKSPEEGRVENYYPLGRFSSDGSLAVVKTSFENRPQLVAAGEDGGNKILKTINPSDLNISFNGSTFCWSEQVSSPRWGNSSSSEIRIFKPENSDYRLITRGGRYFAPAVSPDGSMIAAVEFNQSFETSLVLLDADTGTVLRKFRQQDGSMLMQPSWAPDSADDEGSIVYIYQNDNQKSIRRLDLPGGRVTELKAPSFTEIGEPEIDADGNIYFISTAAGVSNINMITPGGDEYQIVSRAFGTASPEYEDGSLLFADYGPSGWSVAEVEVSARLQLPVDLVKNLHVDYFEPLLAQEAAALEEYGHEGGQSESEWEIEDYDLFSSLFNFHSAGIGISRSGTGYKAYIQADDVLKYTSWQLYGGWDPQRAEILTGIAGAWAGWLPVLLYGAEFTSPLSAFGSSITASVYGGAALPLNLSEGNSTHSINLQSVFYLLTPISQNPSASTAVDSRLNWRLTELSAKKDLQPPLGLNLTGRWYYSLSPAVYNFVQADMSLYFPGFFENHGIKAGVECEYNIGNPVKNFPAQKLPRGISLSGKSYPMLLNTSFNYILPIAYPDLAVGSSLYISRISMNLFIDAAAAGDAQDLLAASPSEWFSTTGFELFSDFHLLDSIVPLRVGIRLLYNISSGNFRFEETTLLLGFNFP